MKSLQGREAKRKAQRGNRARAALRTRARLGWEGAVARNQVKLSFGH